MNYQLIYDNIIAKARSENRKKCSEIYYEKHHIIPKCMGGTNDKENLVLLTAKEHFVCHKLLVGIYPKNKKIWYAYYSMVFLVNKWSHKRDCRISLNEIAELRSMFSVYNSGVNCSSYGIRRTPEENRINSEKHSGKNNPMYGVEPWNKGKHPPGRKLSEKEIADIVKRQTGKKASEETKQKIRDAYNNRDFLICPYCKKESKNRLNMKRWHFDNCKLKDI